MHPLIKSRMRYLLGLILLLFILISCSAQKKVMDIGDNYYIKNDRINPNIEVYRSSINNKKLNGKIRRKTRGLYDSTLNFTLIGNFEKGFLNGSDSIFRNDTLIRIEHYLKGIKNGDQIEFSDAIKVISPFTNGVIHGFQSTYINNRLQKRSYFNRGIKDSVEYFYDSLGQIITTFEYHFDRNEYWEMHLDLDHHNLISRSYLSRIDTLTIAHLKRAEYRGTVSFNSYDPKGYGDAWPPDVIHESIIMNDFIDSQPYFYIIDENTCIVCDYIDHEGIWVAYSNGFELVFYELRAL